MAGANEAVTCCVQIETREALDALDAILEVPGVDTILVGPNDLAASIGHTGRITDPEVEAAITHIIERATAHGVPAGAWTQSTTIARRRREQGFRWVTVSADYGFIVAAADAAVREIRES
jgi:2-dehydro-3-deoxyglucarate aldolase